MVDTDENLPTKTYRRKFTEESLSKETYLHAKRFIAFVTTFFILINGGYSQCSNQCSNLISNADMHMTSPGDAPSFNGSNSFSDNKVSPWIRTYGTPHHFSLLSSNGFVWTVSGNVGPTVTPDDLNCFYADIHPSSASPGAPIWEWVEGSHTNVNFVQNNFLTYCIKYDFDRMRLSSSNANEDALQANVILRAGNGIADLGENQGLFPITLPSANTQTIGTIPINTLGNYSNSITYQPNANYSQFQIYLRLVNPSGANKSAYAHVNNLSITCQTTALSGITSSTGMPGNCGLTWNFSPILNHNGCLKDENYTWTVNGPGVNNANFSNSENSMFTFPGNGKYTVCLKYTDCNGCCAEVCKELEVVECGCQPKQGFTLLNATNGVNISTLLGINQNHNNVRWLVRGNLIINQNTVIDNNSIIEMEPNARITVEPGVRFHVLGNTTLQAGCDQMWAGVFYSGFGSYRVWNSTMRDAENALNIAGAAMVQLVGNTFERNFNCINVTRASRPFRGLSGNTFTGAIPLIAPRNGQLGNAGIIGIDVGDLSVGAIMHPNSPTATGNNTFTQLMFAINLDRYKNFFTSSNFYTNMQLGSTTIRLENQTVNGFSNLSNNFFNTGTVAIRILRCNGIIDIRSNNFSAHVLQSNGIGRGIFVNDCQNLKLRIQNTNIFNTTFAPVSVQNIRGGEVMIQNNIFNTSSQNVSVGDVIPQCLIESNVFNTVGISSIIVSNLPLATIRLNTINANGNNGIRASSCPGIVLFNNTVNNGNAISFEINNSENFNAQCNKLNSCNRGINISSTLLGGGLLKTNDMNTIATQSLRLSNCAIGTQDKHGNLFSPNAEGQLINSDPQDNLFLFRNSTPPAARSWFPLTQTGVPPGIIWFDPQTLGTNLVCGTQPQASTLPLTGQLTNAINGNVLNNMYYEQNVWSSQWWAMLTLMNNQSLMSGNPVFTNFYNNSSAIKSYFDMDKSIGQLYDYTVNEMSTLNGFSISLEAKLTELDALQALVTDQNFTSYIAQIEAKHAEIIAIIDAISPFVISAKNRAVNNAYLLKIAVGSLPEPKYFCDEYKGTFNAKLDAILYGDIYAKNQHASNLIDIASKCHIDFGYATHCASSLCNHFGLTFTSSDCSTSQSREIDQKLREFNEINMYPNPTSGRLVVESKIPIKNYVILDLSGKLIRSNEVEASLYIDLDVNTMPNGVYFIKINDETGKTFVKKIIKL